VLDTVFGTKNKTVMVLTFGCCWYIRPTPKFCAFCGKEKKKSMVFKDKKCSEIFTITMKNMDVHTKRNHGNKAATCHTIKS
jgi:hypothetical protein